MAMLLKHSHPSKVLLEMLANDPGSVMCFNDVHSAKALSPIDVTDSGIVTLSKDVQCTKAHGSMIVSDPGRVIRAKDRQPAKAFVPMDVTDSGIVTVRTSWQSRKVAVAISPTWDSEGLLYECLLLSPLQLLLYCKRPSRPIRHIKAQRTPPSPHHLSTIPRSGHLYSEELAFTRIFATFAFKQHGPQLFHRVCWHDFNGEHLTFQGFDLHFLWRCGHF